MVYSWLHDRECRQAPFFVNLIVLGALKRRKIYVNLITPVILGIIAKLDS